MKKFMTKRKSMIGKRCLLYLLGTICIFAVGGIKAEGKGIDIAEAKDKEGKYYKQTSISAAYAGVLGEYMEDAKEKEEQPRFSLIYLDSDKIPELVVMCGERHPDGGYLYSYEDGKAVLVGDPEEWIGYGEYGCFVYIEKEARFWNGHEGTGNVYDEICEWNGEEVTILQQFEYLQTVDGEESSIYKVDEKEVSSEEYHEGYEKWSSDNEKVLNYHDCYDVPETATETAVRNAWETTDSEQKDTLYSRLMGQTGCTEDEEPVFDYDDYDADGHYEAFAIYEGLLWRKGWKRGLLCSAGNRAAKDMAGSGIRGKLSVIRIRGKCQ